MATGNKGRFAERLKKIRLFRSRKRSGIEQEEEKKEYNSFYNVLKVAAAIPGIVYESLNTSKKNSNKKELEIKESIIIDSKAKEKLIDELITISTKDTDKELYIVPPKNDTINNNLNEVEISNIENSKGDVSKDEKPNLSQNVEKDLEIVKIDDEDTKEIDEIRKLEKKIIDTIKKELIKMANDLEIDESELFILNQIYGDEVVLDKCKKNLDRIKNLIYKIDIIKNKYSYLKDNYDFEYILEYNNKSLLDDIIDLKRKVNDAELKAISNEYKLLKIFESQYFVIDKIENEANNLEENIQKKKDDLEKRDIDFKELQHKLYNISDVPKKYNDFVLEQQEIINKINKDIETINSKEVVDLKLVGFDKLLSNSFKYLGLLMLSPLRGIFPGIVMQTAVTRNVIGNLRNNLHFEEVKRLEYSAIDYSHELSNVIDDLSLASNNIDLTLEEIVNLKVEYNKKFKKYQNDFSQYREVIDKIDDMENKLLGSKYKVEIMKAKVSLKEEINAKKLILVHDMNKQDKKD